RLESDITLSSTAPITTSTQVFGGVLEGNSKTILVQTTKTYATALFECVGNATFANFTLSKFNIETNLETPVFKLGILANDAINSSFTNIIVVDSSIKVDNASTASSFSPTEIYVGGLVGCATDSTISKCEVMLYNGTESDGSVKYAVSLTITGNGESSVYVGGVVGALLATSAGVANIDDCYSNFDICPYMEPISSIPPVIYIGTMAGLSDGATVTNTDADSEYYKYPFIATDEQPEHLPVKDIIGTEN
ncbi:MAG: hypothetical protein IJA72_04055, partial [Clostridia bacterium]|nr:hypothetical protein [Clostridia bacterium]